MTNDSIYSAFARMWEHILIKINDHTHDTNNITSGVLDVENGGTGCDSIIDTTYDAPRYRASALVFTETNPDYNGTINWVCE